MSNAYFTIPKPYNEPVLGYMPGSSERSALKAELARQSETVVTIPLIIGGKEVFGDEYYRLNVQANIDRTAADFWADTVRYLYSKTMLGFFLNSSISFIISEAD